MPAASRTSIIFLVLSLLLSRLWRLIMTSPVVVPGWPTVEPGLYYESTV
jgi:hypothetical protein